MSRVPERFNIESELGRGGMGVVYKAFDAAFGRQVAIKVLPDELENSELLIRFQREGSDLARLSHPNVVRCFEFGSHNEKYFIVMEYVSGGTLRHFAAANKDMGKILGAYCSICDGLDHIHAQGIVHRDVKPGNILFTEQGTPKITDFGISRRLDSNTELTQVGTIMGTSSFVAPEMITQGSAVTPSADLYALGVCLFESLTGKLPITGETDFAVLNAHLNEEPPRASHFRPEIPPPLDRIIAQLLAKDPHDRPESAAETGRLLRACLEESLSIKPPEVVVPFADEPTRAKVEEPEPEGLLTIDSDGLIDSCNSDAAALLGVDSSELFGQPVDRFLPKLKGVWGRAGGMKGQTFQVEAHRYVEQAVPLEVTLTATRSARGQQFSAVLKPGDMALSGVTGGTGHGELDFLNRMAHEVWTPMNGILGMARLTLNTDLNQDQRKYIKALEYSATQLQDVLSTAMDFSRLGSGSLQLEPVPINLRQFVESVIKPFVFQAGAKGLDLDVHFDPLIPDNIVADPARLKQVLHHLLQNAVKFTEKGGIGVQVTRESGDHHVVELKFSISDTGKGITPGKERSVFKPFYQEDSSIRREHGGVGLGLAIVQGLARRMKGKTWVDSQPGRGSIFHFKAGFGVADTPNATAFRLKMGNLRVLLVDPGAELQAVEKIMRRWGLEVTPTRSSRSAGAYIEDSREKGTPFDLVLVEVHGPHLDAFEFVRSYKLSHEAFVLFAGEVQEGDNLKCRRLGVDALLEKPLDPTELWDSVLRILQDGPRSRNAGFGSLSILLAEDNPVNQTLAIALLNSRGHTVRTAENGLEVLELLKEEQFDLILMDIQMPQLDGISTTRQIRRDETGGKRTPIVALTAQTEEQSLEECLSAGVDAYLNKPIDEDELMEVIARVVDESEASVSDGEKSEQSAVIRDTETTNYSVVDEKMLLARVGNKSATLCSLIDIFFNLHKDQIAKVKEAIEEADPSTLQSAAHKFKGSVLNFGAQAAAEAAEALENLGRAGSTSNAQNEYVNLVRETEILVVALRSIRARHS